MDPITKAARSFIEQARYHFERRGCPWVRFVCTHNHRGGMLKALQLWEHAPDNRRPIFMYEHSYRDRDSYFNTLSDAIQDDYEIIRQNASKEGVELPAFDSHQSPTIATLPPIERAITYLEHTASLLGNRFHGILAVLLPNHVQDLVSWRQSVSTWMVAPFSKRVRLAFFDPPGGPLDGMFGESTACFSVDTDEVFEYLKQQAHNKSQGPAVPAHPILTEAQRKDHEASTGQKLMSDDEARALRQLVVEAMHHVAKGRAADAAAAYAKARAQCQSFGLRLEEATILVGMADIALSTQALDQALEYYRLAVEIGESTGNLQLVAHVKLAFGQVYFMQQQYLQAVTSYEIAADAAQKADLPMLRIEALRMAGTCHVLRGARNEAIPYWQRALTEGAALDDQMRRATSFRDVAEQFSKVLEQAGLRQQADHVRSMADALEPGT